MDQKSARIAVIIPAYKVARHLVEVVNAIPPIVHDIIVVNDACPDKSWQVLDGIQDDRVHIVHLEQNQGVGGAVMAGYKAAMDKGAEIMVKVDGDGQMDPRLIPLFIDPIALGRADYTKGNRFFNPEDVINMPLLRLIGNAGLSFLGKLSSGYWHLFDPTNGYTATHARVASLLPMHKIATRYFFESDLLFRLNIIRASVIDIPMRSVYEDEKSNLNPAREIWPFFTGHMRNFGKRIFYNYFLRNFSVASLELLLGLIIFGFGFIFGMHKWIQMAALGEYASIGTVMLIFLTLIVGIQFLMSFINFDINSTPRSALWPNLRQL